MGIRSLMSAAHAAGFAMASSEDLLKSSTRSLAEIGRGEVSQPPFYTYVPTIERESSPASANRNPVVVGAIPHGRSLVPVAAKPANHDRIRHYWWGWLSGRAVA